MKHQIHRLGPLRMSAGLLVTAALMAVTAAGANPGRPAARGAAQGQPAKKPLSLDDLQTMVRAEGLKGTMHGANHGTGTYVFTWWDPQDFFRNVNFALVPANDAVKTALGGLERHQQVSLKGTLVRQPGMPPHIRAEALTPGEKWSPGVRVSQPPAPTADLRQTLRDRGRIPAMVHALDQDGGILVIEHAGEVIPVVVPREEALLKQVGSLYRGDRIELQYVVRPHPPQPLHLQIDAAAGERALVVTDAIRRQHDTLRTVEGSLVLFPKSPALRRSIWGVEERGADGLNRYFTIFNFADLKDQDRTDAKLRAAWEGKDGVADARNKYVHPGVRVRVTGTVNNPAPNQANPALRTDSSRVEVVAP